MLDLDDLLIYICFSVFVLFLIVWSICIIRWKKAYNVYLWICVCRWDKIIRHLYNQQRPSATIEKSKFQEQTEIQQQHQQAKVKFVEENEIVPRYSQIEHIHKMHGATNEAFVAENINSNTNNIINNDNYQIVRELKDNNTDKTIVVTKL